MCNYTHENEFVYKKSLLWEPTLPAVDNLALTFWIPNDELRMCYPYYLILTFSLFPKAELYSMTLRFFLTYVFFGMCKIALIYDTYYLRGNDGMIFGSLFFLFSTDSLWFCSFIFLCTKHIYLSLLTVSWELNVMDVGMFLKD